MALRGREGKVLVCFNKPGGLASSFLPLLEKKQKTKKDKESLWELIV